MYIIYAQLPTFCLMKSDGRLCRLVEVNFGRILHVPILVPYAGCQVISVTSVNYRSETVSSGRFWGYVALTQSDLRIPSQGPLTLKSERNVRKRTFWRAPNEESNNPAHPRILITWRIFASLAIQNAPSEDSDQTARMRRLIWIFAGRTWPKVFFWCSSSRFMLLLFWLRVLPNLISVSRGSNMWFYATRRHIVYTWFTPNIGTSLLLIISVLNVRLGSYPSGSYRQV